MPVNLIPAIDPAPLPGPPWLFHALWLVTFLVHLVFVNMVMGGMMVGRREIPMPIHNRTRSRP